MKLSDIGYLPVAPTIKEALQELLGVDKIITRYIPSESLTFVKLIKGKFKTELYISDSLIQDQQFNILKKHLERGVSLLDEAIEKGIQNEA